MYHCISLCTHNFPVFGDRCFVHLQSLLFHLMDQISYSNVYFLFSGWPCYLSCLYLYCMLALLPLCPIPGHCCPIPGHCCPIPGHCCPIPGHCCPIPGHCCPIPGHCCSIPGHCCSSVFSRFRFVPLRACYLSRWRLIVKQRRTERCTAWQKTCRRQDLCLVLCAAIYSAKPSSLSSVTIVLSKESFRIVLRTWRSSIVIVLL